MRQAPLGILQRVHEIVHLAVPQGDGRAPARAVAIVVEEQPVEALAPEERRDAEQLRLGAAIAAAVDDQAVRLGAWEPPALDLMRIQRRRNRDRLEVDACLIWRHHVVVHWAWLAWACQQ